MLTCPAATARLLTDRLLPQVLVCAAASTLAAFAGYFGSTWIPAAFGGDSVNAAGSITLAAGGLLALAVLASPSHGVIAAAARRARLRRSIELDDLLAALFREEETGQRRMGALRPAAAQRAIGRGLVARTGDRLALTDPGRAQAREVVRRHRLWEAYLVERAGLSPDHVHETAERLEHLGVRPAEGPALDPHGREIPRGSSE
ncbi:MAG: metal-dependent transcriptional regulator, partial [Phycisphaerales bacterium]